MNENQVEGVVDEGVGRVQDAFGAVTGDGELQAKGKVSELTGSAKQVYGKAADQAKDLYGKASEQAKTLYGKTVDQSKELADQTKDLVTKQPWTALAVAAVGGLIAGLVLRGDPKTIYIRRS